MATIVKRLCVPAALVLAVPVLSAPGRAGTLEIAIHGLRADGGTVNLAVFAADAAGDFPVAEAALRVRRLPERAGGVTLSERALPEGRYAISVYQDSNGSGELDTNMLGIPTEPYGFSETGGGASGPPDFAEAAVRVPATGTARTTVDVLRP